jgi:hypothetical protein
LNDVAVVRYFGSGSKLVLGSDIETLCIESFTLCQLISSVTFDSSSKLKRIEGKAFDCCSSLQSIYLVV